MQYRRLSLEELKELEKEFTQFLAANDVFPDTWENMKKETPEKAEHLIEQFSDLVFNKVLGKIQYLEHASPKELKIFHFQEDKIEMVGLAVDPANTTIDLTDQTIIDQLAKDYESLAQEGDVKVFNTEKGYSKDPKQEIFELSESDCYVVDGTLFNTLKAFKS